MLFKRYETLAVIKNIQEGSSYTSFVIGYSSAILYISSKYKISSLQNK